MNIEPGSPAADPADVAEQHEDVEPSRDDDEGVVDPEEPPWEVDEADVAEQRLEVPGLEEDPDES